MGSHNGSINAKVRGTKRQPRLLVSIPAEVRDPLNALCAADRRNVGQMIAWLIEQEVARRAAAKGGAS